MRRCSAAVILAAAALTFGCGARSTIAERDGEAAAGGRAASAAGSTSGPTASGAGGGGGEVPGGGGGGAAPGLGCDHLVWAGDAVLVGEGLTARSREVRLVPLGRDDVALAHVEVDASGGAAMRHRRVAPWGPWPPPPSSAPPGLDVAGGGTPIGAAPLAADAFAFAVADDLGNLLVGTAGATTSASIATVVERPAARVRWLSAALAPDLHLLGYGPESSLSIDLVSSTGPQVTRLGALGCTSAPLASAALRVDGGVLVASANGTPFDDCLDPDAPEEPRVVQTVIVSADGTVTPGAGVEAGGVVHEVHVAARDGGAWLAWQTDADEWAQVVPVTRDGVPEPAGLSYGVSPRHQLALLGDGGRLALVTAGSSETGEAAISVALVDDAFGHVAATSGPPGGLPRPSGRPAVVASPDGRSILVAVETDLAPSAPLALMRADCAG